ncbi:YppE family protein [Halalkalibacter alkalisediminis]|uniref:YppE family protein n=1 Tax=Halalkalibacter alkalisediminis TaxID=935616 RepID=A0ABV6NGN8_9BACI|nr:YppE family protein [Halalkalibacter alkalisediminis]
MNEMTRSELKYLTNALIRLNKKAEEYYIKAREEEGEVDFFGVVKPFAEDMAKVRDLWMPLAQEFVQKEKPLHLHPSQLQQTEENLEIVAIKSFYKETSKKRQMETFKSVEYVLNQMLGAIDK